MFVVVWWCGVGLAVVGCGYSRVKRSVLIGQAADRPLCTTPAHHYHTPTVTAIPQAGNTIITYRTLPTLGIFYKWSWDKVFLS